MSKSRPQSAPQRAQASTTAKSASKPELSPAPGAGVTKAGCGCGGGAGNQVGSSAALMTSMQRASQSAPVIRPSRGAGTQVAAWQNNKSVTGLWSINEDRNSWVLVDGLEWKKLSVASNSGVMSLTMLGAHAFASGSTVNYRDEDDGMIHEMYVW